jgi:prophage regulatory protein
MPRYLRLPALKQKYPMSTSSIYAQVAAGKFPAPHRLSARAVAWDEDEVDAFLEKNVGLTRSDAVEFAYTSARVQRD